MKESALITTFSKPSVVSLLRVSLSLINSHQACAGNTMRINKYAREDSIPHPVDTRAGLPRAKPTSVKYLLVVHIGQMVNRTARGLTRPFSCE